MNGYGRLPDIQRDLAGVAADKLIPELLTLRDEVSREFDRETRRTFFTSITTRYYSGDGCRELWLGEDLISVTTLKVSATADQPTTFDYTLASGTDYTLWPRNAAAQGKPYRKIILNPDGQLSTFPKGVDNVQLVGAFGYSEEWEAAVADGVAVTGTLSSAGDLSLALLAAGAVFAGDMLKLEDEQVEVSALVGAGLTATVVRARNGTTAASHSAVQVYIRRYPRDVENAVKERTVGRRWDAQGGHQGYADGGSPGDSRRGSYARWFAACADYVDPAAVL